MPLPPSASDWIRFQKLKSSAGYDAVVRNNFDVQTMNRLNPCVSNREVIRTDRDRISTSTGRTRREASKWIDFVASQNTDFISVSEMPNSAGQGFGRQLNRTQICANNVRCVTTAPFITGRGIGRPAYQHLRL